MSNMLQKYKIIKLRRKALYIKDDISKTFSPKTAKGEFDD